MSSVVLASVYHYAVVCRSVHVLVSSGVYYCSLLPFCLCRIVSSLDAIAATVNLPTGGTLRDSTDTFDLEISRVEPSDVPNEGHTINFGKTARDECVLPKTLFNRFSGDVVLSSSVISQTAVFQGDDSSLSFASKVVSVTVIGESISNLADPVMLTFEKVTNVCIVCPFISIERPLVMCFMYQAMML